ncbi:MAG: OmpH family outer membrane protein [Fusobacterium sp. JB021]|nr:OmpH family outer membrane protein [Fusobacterium sp. JB020]MDP0493136.1 OmpH family outer membrane protein [Fusobacterium sp. JB021]MDP0507441.1 OmpH family outer membrane protein [Fusobacterium sp. JB019]
MKKLALLAMTVVMSTSALALEIGVVNSQELFYKYSKTKLIDQNLQKEGATLDNTLKQKQVELKKLQIELNSKGDKATEKDKKIFNDKVKMLEKFVKDSKNKMAKERNEKVAEVENVMNKAISKVAKNKKLDYILEAGAVKFGGKDVTKEVLAEMEKNK